MLNVKMIQSESSDVRWWRLTELDWGDVQTPKKTQWDFVKDDMKSFGRSQEDAEIGEPMDDKNQGKHLPEVVAGIGS